MTPLYFHPLAGRPSRWWLAATLALAALPARAADAAEPALIRWSPEQVQAAGILTRKLATAPAVAELTLPGTVVLPPQSALVVAAPVAGVLLEVLASPGQVVRAGQPLARLSSTQVVEWRRELAQAQAQLQLAESRSARDEQLAEAGIIAQARLQESQSQLRLARLAVAERQELLRLAGAGAARAALDGAVTLAAPAPATVLEVPATPGQRLEAGMPVARLGRGQLLALDLQATPEQAGALRVGNRLAVGSCRARARLTAIVPQVSGANQAVQVRAELPGGEGCVRVNQFVQARLEGGASAPAGLQVPLAALVRKGGQNYVFVREAQGFRAAPVSLGDGGGEWLPVREGLRAGDEVVVRGAAALKGAWMGLGGGER